MALKLGELVAYLKTDNSGLKRGLAEGKAEIKAAGADMGRDVDLVGKAIGEKLGAGGAAGGEKFTRDVNGKLRDAHGRFVREGEQLGKGLGDGLGNGVKGHTGWLSSVQSAVRSLGTQVSEAGNWVRNAGQRVSDFAGNVTSVIGSVWGFVAVLAALSTAAAVAIPAVGLLGGVLGSLPALAGGAGIGIGALVIGFAGLADHFKQTSAAGGAVVDKTWQVRQAVLALGNAQREERAAQEALTRARGDEIERLSDLNRELREARNSEEEAALDAEAAEKRLAEAKNAVQIAQQKLNDAQRSGDVAAVRQATQELLDAQRQQPDEIRRAELAYERAKLAVEAAKDRTEDLTVEQQRAARVGVEGSDQVRAALDRQRRAVEAVEAAEHALAEARKPAGGGGGAAQQLMRLAPAAQDLVNVLKSLKPAWDDLRLDVQQRLFAGVGGEVKSLASAWLPTLREKLGQSADTANSLFKTFSTSVKKPEFIENISEGLDTVDRLVDKVGGALAGPFVDAWGRLSKAAGPFLDAVGDEVAGLVEDFARWIEKADKSGGLEDFFEKAGDFFRDVVDMGKDVGAIIGDIVGALFDDPANANGGDTWESFKQTLKDVREWFDDPKNQKTIQDWFHKLETAAAVLGLIVGWATNLILCLDKADTKFREWAASTKKAVDGLGKWLDEKWDKLVTSVSKLPGRIGKAASGMWDGVKDSFRAALNWVIGKWNNFELKLPTAQFLGATIGGGSIGTPNIPFLGDGGVVRATPGGRLVNVAERGEDEAVIPLSKLGSLGGHSELRITGELVARGSDLVLVLRENIAGLGGDVQKAVGTSA
ncbi:hypothetical protein [Micromonospora sp. CB01531]|uniref:hypothetical protein n=1 Tax=Micromonospora sp. CB01531 TaxID=1718947 RepID=UPI00093B506F|nr:hypothetical protein [Micromonospora sp. CB01531]OKI47237.1 hypothetical protein A6A27_10335 [Micromonospora sp. CB01531]